MLLKRFFKKSIGYPSNVAILMKLYHAVTQDNLQCLGNDFPVWHLETTSRKRKRDNCQKFQKLLQVAATAGSFGVMPVV